MREGGSHHRRRVLQVLNGFEQRHDSHRQMRHLAAAREANFLHSVATSSRSDTDSPLEMIMRGNAGAETGVHLGSAAENRQLRQRRLDSRVRRGEQAGFPARGSGAPPFGFG